MIIIFGGYPHTEQFQILPNPQLANQEQVQDERDYRISMDKTVHSYVKTVLKTVHIFSFSTTREVAAEFELFIQQYGDLPWRIYDHHNNFLDGHLINNPIQITYSGKFTTACNARGYSGNERATFEIEFDAETVA